MVDFSSFFEFLAFAPLEPFRHYLLPWFGCLIVHVGWAHFVSNILFFLYFAWRCCQVFRVLNWVGALLVGHLLVLGITSLLCFAGLYFFNIDTGLARLVGLSSLVMLQVGFLLGALRDRQALLFLAAFALAAFFSKQETGFLTHFTHGAGLLLGLLYGVRHKLLAS